MKKEIISLPTKRIYSTFTTLPYQICYNLFNGYSLLPKFITFIVTERCNLKCQMCPFSVRSVVNQVIEKKELTFSEIKRIIDEVSGFKPLKPSFTITGGEPFLRNDILEIMKYIEFKGLRYSFITNGSLITKKIADKIVELNPVGITFSIDGPEDIHDEIRSVNGTFKKAVVSPFY